MAAFAGTVWESWSLAAWMHLWRVPGLFFPADWDRGVNNSVRGKRSATGRTDWIGCMRVRTLLPLEFLADGKVPIGFITEGTCPVGLSYLGGSK